MHNILRERHIVFEDEDSELEQLFVVASVLPVSTAICERDFSIQNLIKTMRRTRLNERSLMRSSINGPPPGEMDFVNNIMTWIRSFPSECNPPQISAADSEDLQEIDWQQILTRSPDSVHKSNFIRGKWPKTREKQDGVSTESTEDHYDVQNTSLYSLPLEYFLNFPLGISVIYRIRGQDLE
ncbi:hypothetical protein RvY_17000 [Ramazzottius varieornatus]|uniref:HAT C-terminal dimerisation domain-containing protein n=1 Tax=Ramazzottius varieornatus TaxID=947166 RepID=A0A1D1W0J4_RAMVA|nr:hypothetical protein RvY_17000 [Ramazzottius varieornatus]